MAQQYNKSRFLELLDEMKDIQKRKNSGYAGEDNPDPWANFRLAKMLGVKASVGCLIRASDKFIRVCNLIRRPQNEQVGESLHDTLIDLANYCLIVICLLEEEQEEENDKKK